MPSETPSSLRYPARWIATNAGLEGSVVVNQVRSAKKGQGLNVDSGEITDLVKNGIIDPTMVTRSALQNAASIAKNILTTEAVVVDANHPLAGVTLNFDVTIRAVRAATQEELAHGHPHGADGHDHSHGH